MSTSGHLTLDHNHHYSRRATCCNRAAQGLGRDGPMTWIWRTWLLTGLQGKFKTRRYVSFSEPFYGVKQYTRALVRRLVSFPSKLCMYSSSFRIYSSSLGLRSHPLVRYHTRHLRRRDPAKIGPDEVKIQEVKNELSERFRMTEPGACR